MISIVSERKQAALQCKKAAAWLKKVQYADQLQLKLEDAAVELSPQARAQTAVDALAEG